LSQATSSYQNGDIAGALKEIGAGLQQSPNAGPLLDLQNRVRQMNNLIGPLQAAEATSAADDVTALLQEQQSCQSIISLESDPLNTFRKRAEAAETRIAASLAQAASANAAKGADALQAGNEKDAIKYYNLAAQANPNDPSIASQRQSLMEKVAAECKKFYDQGIIDEQLQQDDQARQAFQQVLNLSSPGEHYYDLANTKLKDLMSQ
jgi:tetratricopeptide (TPR) repeat protein